MKYLYPEGKGKALTFSYDDGQHFDRKLVEIFNKNGLKATFHLNSGTLSDDTDVNGEYKISPDGNAYVRKCELKELYAGHEVACHGVEHKFLPLLTKTRMVTETLKDREALENLTGYNVHGMSYAFGAYSPEIEDVLDNCGIKYCRTVNSTNGFWLPANFLEWHPTCHHGAPNLMDLGADLLNAPGYMELPLMYVWGHSFEFGRANDFSVIEKFAEFMGGHRDVWYATNGEICDYVTAIRNLDFSADGKRIYNPSLLPVWYEENGETKVIKSGGTVEVL